LLLAGAFVLACTVPATASYAADRPLLVVFRDTVTGGFAFTEGDGGYSGTLKPGESYTASFTRDVSPGATIRFEHLSIYWTWSHIDQAASYPTMEVRLGGPEGPLLERSARYTDSKGFASKNDFFSGLDSYLLPGPVPGNFSVTVSNTAADGTTFAIQGTSLLTVYEEPGARKSDIWIAEGADLLYRSYGIPPELATARVEFPGRVDIPRVESARLLLVAPSAGFSREEVPDMNQVMMNTPGPGQLPPLVEPVLKVLFPHYKGHSWSDVFSADEDHQIGIAQVEVKPFLRYSDNFIDVRDNGDYFMLSNAVLCVTYREEKE
jgi:hypothetical protein